MQLARHDLVRLAAMAAGIVVFAQTELELVPAGKEQEVMAQAIRDAIWIARTTDEAIQSDDEMGG